ncbi:MAG: hypothetical protein IH936_08750 [Acidobacteria bacterium]|nr:hypothetical protein [Acidobacteriota bacterium]
MKCSAKTLAVAGCLLGVVLFAQMSVAETGTVCDVPEFDFQWPDANNPSFIVELKQPGFFSFEIKGWDKDGDPRCVPVRRRQLYAGRNEIYVDLTGFDFYLANTAVVDFKSFDQGLDEPIDEPIDEPTCGPTDGPTDSSNSNSNVCLERRQGQRQVVVFEKQILKLDAGSVFSRNKDDGFDSSLELAINATSRWTSWLTGVVDLRLSEISAIDEAEQSMDSTSGMDPMDEMEATKIFNPFAEGGSIVRGDFYAIIHPRAKNKIGSLYPPPFGFLLGSGFSTFSGGSDSVEAKQRYFYGLRLQVLGYNRKKAPEGFGGTTGYVQFGLARDDLWRFEELVDTDSNPVTDAVVVMRDERDRIFFEAALEFPKLGSDAARMAVRLFADLPESGNGPADIRVSILAAIDLKAIGKTFGAG